MESVGIAKVVVSYNALLGGLRMYNEMKDERVSPNILTYSTLIDVFSKGGLYAEAMKVFKEFKHAGLKAKVVLYSELINALCKNGLVESALSLLVSGGRVFEIHAGDREDNRFMKMFGQLAAEKAGYAIKDRKVRQEILCILGVFQKMHVLDTKPNVVTFSAILNACSRCNSFEDASMLFEQLRLFGNQVYGVAHALLMDFLRTSYATFSGGRKQGAQLIVHEGKRRNVWESVRSDSCLDLHLTSSGVAQAMVHVWLLNIRAIVFKGQQLPNLLSILTGWGKHSKVVADSTLRRAIEALLTGIGAPFHVAKCNLGRFISTSSVAAAWLKESGTLEVLVLHDDRTYTKGARLGQG
ncbi:hypothetical protein C1H46_034804 [Malus baccata]|uniref:Smr domain-containing protein n=1 Tax=Malus baccata TaxID=106549 RepID=A0A540KZH3_MALBA|nr:hypothetical protein C1H46_034804 [Malus baccata]